MLRFFTIPSVLCAFILCATNASTVCAASHKVQSRAHTIEAGGIKRSYRLYVPTNLDTEQAGALVIVLHGGGGNARGAEKQTGFSEMADRGRFIVAYPEGVEKTWNDGRVTAVSRAHRENLDDVGFIAAMIDAVARVHRIDPRRIFATGISNGAIFAHYLAANLSARIAAIAPVAGGIADPFYRRFKPEQPVSVLILQGTRDPLVPFDGGEVAWGERGRIISTAAAVERWVAHDRCAEQPRSESLPDNDPTDRCVVHRSTWSPCRDGTEVTLLTLEGGGHTWPGGAQYLPQRLIGGVCRDIDATEVIWDFFARHPKR